MLQIIIYLLLAFAAGFGLAWFLQQKALYKQQKELKSTSGFLESERLMKETMQKELAVVHQHKMAIELELTQKLRAAEKLIRQMDTDILLMQKSYEETEALLLSTNPELHSLKLQLLEAQNTIARLKSRMAEQRITN